MCLDIDDPHITTTQWWWELWGLFPHFFFIRDFSQDIFSYAKNYAKKTFQKRVFFSCGRVGLCVKEFKCLFTKHFARAWQGMFLKKKSCKIGFIFWAEEFSFNGNYSMLNSFKLRIATVCRENIWISLRNDSYLKQA